MFVEHLYYFQALACIDNTVNIFMCIAFIFIKSIPRFLEEKVNFICLLVEYFVCKVEFNFLKILSISLLVWVCVWGTQTERESQCACVEVRSQFE